MASMDEKLKQFAYYVIDDATKQRDALLKEIESEKTHNIDNEELELLSGAYSQIQNVITKSRRTNNENVLKIEMDLKKKLILKREEIINDVFKEVRQRLINFTKNEEYKNWLKAKLQKAVSEVGAGTKIVYISKSDMNYQKFLEDGIENITVLQAEEDDIVGGVRVYNSDKNVFIDYSIDNMIDEQRNQFLQMSGLSIY